MVYFLSGAPNLKARSLELAGANVRAQWPITKGAGVVIGIVDSGVEWSHPDIQPNYLSSASWDFNFDDPDPTPFVTALAAHGTEAAGVAAARDDNGIGVAGAAPRAVIAGLRLLAAPTSDEQQAAALNHLPGTIHISNNSWGPPDDGNTLRGPGPWTSLAMQSAIASGRNAKGRIFVWSAG